MGRPSLSHMAYCSRHCSATPNTLLMQRRKLRRRSTGQVSVEWGRSVSLVVNAQTPSCKEREHDVVEDGKV